MFDTLSGRLGDVFERLKKRAVLKEADIDAAMRDVRVALLEADVALPVVKDFIAEVKKRALGEEVLRSVTPGQMVVKVVHDHLVETLGAEASEINLNAVPPVPVMMVGLQGSGKTTTTAKLGLRLQNKDKKKVLMASLDVRRPAAQEQLKVLGEQAQVATLPIIAGQMPVDIAKRAMQAAKLQGVDVVLLDTAGRLSIDESLMAELVAVRDAVTPSEIMLVADSLTGQDAVNTAKRFNERVGLTGIALTRIDGDGRGGAALVHARGHRLPDQADGHGRGSRQARGLPPQAHRLAHPRHGRRCQPRREGFRDDRGGRSRKTRQKDEKRRVRLRRSRLPSSARCASSAGCRACSACSPASARSRTSWQMPISTTRCCRARRRSSIP